MKTFSAGAILALALALHSGATTVPYKSFDQLVKEADGIVSGHVAAVESQYSPQKEIYTFVTFERLHVLAGSYQDSTLVLRFKGGQVGNDILHVDGSPEFKVNEDVVLFVQGNGHYMVPLVGWTQGVFRIVQDAATGQQSVHDYEGNRVLGIQAGQVLRERLVLPEAQIVGERQAIRSEATKNEASAGVPDYGASTATEPTQALGASAFRNSPTMTHDSFIAAIQKSAATKTNTTRLNNLSIADFSVPSDNVDAFTGPKPLIEQVPQSHAPAVPKRLPEPQTKEQF